MMVIEQAGEKKYASTFYSYFSILMRLRMTGNCFQILKLVYQKGIVFFADRPTQELHQMPMLLLMMMAMAMLLKITV